MQFLGITHALATAGIYAGIAIVGGLFVFHLATYRTAQAVAPITPQPEPTPEVEPDPIVEPTPEVEPEVIEPETEPEPIVDRVEELFAFYRGMTLRALRKEVKGRVRGIRSLTRDDLALRLAEAVAAA